MRSVSEPSPHPRSSIRSPVLGFSSAKTAALPPVIGWTAVRGTLDGPDLAAVALFAIVFMWQMPHFLAIAWMYRDEYARAGIPLLPVIQPDGRSTGRQAVLYAAALIPLTMMPTLIGLSSPTYLAGAIVLGVWAFVLLEIINYVEHYGLLRRQIDGRYEPVREEHSWNADFTVSNWILFNLQLHSDHHAHMERPYEELRTVPGAPQMPAGYPAMVLLALVPPLWFATMDPRVPVTA